MRVAFRADAGIGQGTGHVMRCLTLADGLADRGHDVHFFTSRIDIDWLDQTVRATNISVHDTVMDDLSRDDLIAVNPDWVVVDSYRINATQISSLARELPVMAIVDGDDRKIDASLYLDQNLGAESLARRRGTASSYLAGAPFTLVRREILKARPATPWVVHGTRPRVLCFMGGTDPTGEVVGVATALSRVADCLELTVVAPQRLHSELDTVFAESHSVHILDPTPQLPDLMAHAEIIVSAAGTSAWDICALGIPAVFVAVADNQRFSLTEAVARGLALGIDATADKSLIQSTIVGLVMALVNDVRSREQLSRAARAAFDGEGVRRVIERLELGGTPIS